MRIDAVLARNVATIRKAKNLSQEAVALKAGISLRSVQQVERQERWPTIPTVELIATALEVPMVELYQHRMPTPIRIKLADLSDDELLQELRLRIKQN